MSAGMPPRDPLPPVEAQAGGRVIRPDALASAPAVADAMAASISLDDAMRATLARAVARIAEPGVTLLLRTSEPSEGAGFVEVTALGCHARLDDLGCEHDRWSSPGHEPVAVVRVGEAAVGPKLGLVAVPYPGERVTGDGVWIHDRGTHLRVSVIDGLGHGQGAHAATAAAIASLEANRERPLDATVALMHEALRATRGAAIGLGELDRETRRFEWLGVGNIAGLVCDPLGTPRSLASHNGTVGQQRLRARSISYDWPKGTCAVFHSDGIGGSYQLARYPRIERHHPALLATVLFRDFGRGRDDTTVLVVRD